MASGDTTFGDRQARRKVIAELMTDRHARKDMLTGLFSDYFTVPSTIRCEAGDHVVHLNPRDSTITPAVLARGHWNRDELERAIAVLRSYGALRESGIFLDVGANIGTQTIYALLSRTFATVHAFEPEPENARLFRMNIAENGMAADVHFFTHAVGDHEGQVSLHRHPRNFGAHSIVPPPGAARGDEIVVPMTTLDAHVVRHALPQQNIALAWVDVEGGEPGVIKGADRLMTARVPMVIEFLDRDRGRPAVTEMFTLLRNVYSHACCLQDETISAFDSATLTPDCPQGDYLVFSRDD